MFAKSSLKAFRVPEGNVLTCVSDVDQSYMRCELDSKRSFRNRHIIGSLEHDLHALEALPSVSSCTNQFQMTEA